MATMQKTLEKYGRSYVLSLGSRKYVAGPTPQSLGGTYKGSSVVKDTLGLGNKATSSRDQWNRLFEATIKRVEKDHQRDSIRKLKEKHDSPENKAAAERDAKPFKPFAAIKDAKRKQNKESREKSNLYYRGEPVSSGEENGRQSRNKSKPTRAVNSSPSGRMSRTKSRGRSMSRLQELDRKYSFYRSRTSEADATQMTFRPQVLEQEVINRTYTGDDVSTHRARSVSRERSSSRSRLLHKTVRSVQPHMREGYMFSRLQTSVYQQINNLYGDSANGQREKRFYQQLAEVQLEHYKIRYELLEEKEKRILDTKLQQMDQLKGIAKEHERRASRRFMSQYVSTRILDAKVRKRSDIGLPDNLDAANMKRARSRKRRKSSTKTPGLRSDRDKKRFSQIFDFKPGPKMKGPRLPKMAVSTNDDGGKPSEEKSEVNALLQEAEAMLKLVDQDLETQGTESETDTNATINTWPQRDSRHRLAPVDPRRGRAGRRGTDVGGPFSTGRRGVPSRNTRLPGLDSRQRISQPGRNRVSSDARRSLPEKGAPRGKLEYTRRHSRSDNRNTRSMVKDTEPVPVHDSRDRRDSRDTRDSEESEGDRENLEEQNPKRSLSKFEIRTNLLSNVSPDKRRLNKDRNRPGLDSEPEDDKETRSESKMDEKRDSGTSTSRNTRKESQVTTFNYTTDPRKASVSIPVPKPVTPKEEEEKTTNVDPLTDIKWVRLQTHYDTADTAEPDSEKPNPSPRTVASQHHVITESVTIVENKSREHGTKSTELKTGSATSPRKQTDTGSPKESNPVLVSDNRDTPLSPKSEAKKEEIKQQSPSTVTPIINKGAETTDLERADRDPGEGDGQVNMSKTVSVTEETREIPATEHQRETVKRENKYSFREVVTTAVTKYGTGQTGSSVQRTSMESEREEELGLNKWKDLVQKYLRESSFKVGKTADRHLLDTDYDDDDDDEDEMADIFERAKRKYDLHIEEEHVTETNE